MIDWIMMYLMSRFTSLREKYVKYTSIVMLKHNKRREGG